MPIFHESPEEMSTGMFDTVDSVRFDDHIPRAGEPRAEFAPGPNPFDPFAYPKVEPNASAYGQWEALANDKLWDDYTKQNPPSVNDAEKLSSY